MIRRCNFFVSSFNPRTRMGCDFVDDCNHLHASVLQSTHPHGVRRLSSVARRQHLGASIHAPAWGATRCNRGLRRNLQCFNPRTRMGCDLSDVRLVYAEPTASIHAPAWGATSLSRETGEGTDASIHAPAWGATPPTQARGCHEPLQSTHPHGVRQPS